MSIDGSFTFPSSNWSADFPLGQDTLPNADFPLPYGMPQQGMPSNGYFYQQSVPQQGMPSSGYSSQQGMPQQGMPFNGYFYQQSMPQQGMPSSGYFYQQSVPQQGMPSSGYFSQQGMPSTGFPRPKRQRLDSKDSPYWSQPSPAGSYMQPRVPTGTVRPSDLIRPDTRKRSFSTFEEDDSHVDDGNSSQVGMGVPEGGPVSQTGLLGLIEERKRQQAADIAAAKAEAATTTATAAAAAAAAIDPQLEPDMANDAAEEVQGPPNPPVVGGGDDYSSSSGDASGPVGDPVVPGSSQGQWGTPTVEELLNASAADIENFLANSSFPSVSGGDDTKGAPMTDAGPSEVEGFAGNDEFDNTGASGVGDFDEDMWNHFNFNAPNLLFKGGDDNATAPVTDGNGDASGSQGAATGASPSIFPPADGVSPAAPAAVGSAAPVAASGAAAATPEVAAPVAAPVAEAAAGAAAPVPDDVFPGLYLIEAFNRGVDWSAALPPSAPVVPPTPAVPDPVAPIPVASDPASSAPMAPAADVDPVFPLVDIDPVWLDKLAAGGYPDLPPAPDVPALVAPTLVAPPSPAPVVPPAQVIPPVASAPAPAPAPAPVADQPADGTRVVSALQLAVVSDKVTALRSSSRRWMGVSPETQQLLSGQVNVLVDGLKTLEKRKQPPPPGLQGSSLVCVPISQVRFIEGQVSILRTLYGPGRPDLGERANALDKSLGEISIAIGDMMAGRRPELMPAAPTGPVPYSRAATHRQARPGSSRGQQRWR